MGSDFRGSIWQEMCEKNEEFWREGEMVMNNVKREMMREEYEVKIF